MQARETITAPRRRQSYPSRNSGSILLVTLIAFTMTAFLSTSLGFVGRTRTEMAREIFEQLHAELSVHSGVEFARRQLYLDPEWDGTGSGELMTLPDVGSFTVDLNESTIDGDVQMHISGFSPQGKKKLEADFVLVPADPLRSKGLIALDKDIDINKSSFDGDVLLADDDARVLRYDEMAAATDSDGRFRGATIPIVPTATTTLGNTMVYNNTEIYKTGNFNWEVNQPAIVENTLPDPISLPKHDLSSYLIPGPGKVIYSGVTDLAGVSMDETAVFILNPGETLTLTDVDLRGGMVIYVADTYDPKGALENRIRVDGDDNVFGGGVLGAAPNIGVLAPGCELGGADADADAIINGLTYCHSINNIYNFDFTGQVLVVNDIQVMRWSTVTFTPTVGLEPPPGINWFGEYYDQVNLRQLREIFDEVEGGGGGVSEGGDTGGGESTGAGRVDEGDGGGGTGGTGGTGGGGTGGYGGGLSGT